MKKISLLTVALLATMLLFAQTKDRKFAVGLHANLVNYSGDLGNGFTDFSNMFKYGAGKSSLGGAISAALYLSPTFDIVAKVAQSHPGYTATKGDFSFSTKDSYASKKGKKLDIEGWLFCGMMWNTTANLKFKTNNGWMLKENATVAPYIIGGVGFTRLYQIAAQDVKTEKNYSNFSLYYGGGLNVRLNEYLNLAFEAGFYNPMTDSYDGIDKTTAKGAKGLDNGNDNFISYSLGITYNIGKSKDTDADGVPDRKDRCPDTPEGITVDDNGCPVDGDGDGVPDYLDKCPDVAGNIDGCPDSDGDGIIDKNDKCPDVKGLKELQGCPDGDDDKDGVLNLKDKCPDTPEGVKVDMNGCPVDSDGDGVPDYQDKCPDIAGAVNTLGCPIQSKFNEIAKEIYFKSGKSSLTSNSYSSLKMLVDILNQYKDIKFGIEIGGHTDSQGSDASNQRLSERRANVVRSYLIRKGVAVGRVTAVGYGETSPIASNETAEGRALNRRTEIKVVQMK